MIRKPAAQARTLHPVVRTVRTTARVATETSAVVSRTTKRAGRAWGLLWFYWMVGMSALGAVTAGSWGATIVGLLFTFGLWKLGRWIYRRFGRDDEVPAKPSA